MKNTYLLDYLENGEEVLLEIAPNKGFMFHLYDVVLILFVVFFLFTCIMITVGFSSSSHYSSFIPSFAGLAVLFAFLRPFYLRYQNSLNTWYIITNRRIIFKRKFGVLENKWFKNETEFTFENKGNDKGYIIVGKMETPFDDIFSVQESFSKLFKRKGINFGQNHFILDNLSNYSTVKNLINSLRI